MHKSFIDFNATGGYMPLAAADLAKAVADGRLFLRARPAKQSNSLSPKSIELYHTSDETGTRPVLITIGSALRPIKIGPIKDGGMDGTTIESDGAVSEKCASLFNKRPTFKAHSYLRYLSNNEVEGILAVQKLIAEWVEANGRKFEAGAVAAVNCSYPLKPDADANSFCNMRLRGTVVDSSLNCEIDLADLGADHQKWTWDSTIYRVDDETALARNEPAAAFDGDVCAALAGGDHCGIFVGKFTAVPYAGNKKISFQIVPASMIIWPGAAAGDPYGARNGGGGVGGFGGGAAFAEFLPASAVAQRATSAPITGALAPKESKRKRMGDE